MRQSRQGVRSTKVIDEDAMLGFKPTPGVKKKDGARLKLSSTKIVQRPVSSEVFDFFDIFNSCKKHDKPCDKQDMW